MLGGGCMADNNWAVQRMKGASKDAYELELKEKERDREQREKATRKEDRVIMNVCETQYVVVKYVLRKNKWNLSSEPVISMGFDLCWTDNHIKQDVFYKMSQHQRINHFPGMEILSRKNNLGKSLMAFRKRFPEEYDFFPNTWMLPADWPQLKDYNDNRKSGKAQTFIVKPEAACQGRGIYLTRHVEKLKDNKCVVQRYLHRPYLIDGLKFDLRIYVLVAGTDPLRLFVYEEGLARFATEPYCAPRSDNLESRYMHLTNYAINKNSPNFVFNQRLEECDQGHKRTLSSVYKVIEQRGHDSEALKERIDDLFIKTLITGYPTLTRAQQTVHPENYANDMCFEILGFDIMLDEALNPILLEVNYTPSFATETPLDKHIKKNLIMDTLNILGINDQWKAQNRKKRESETKERIMTVKRKKPTLDEKIEAVQSFAKERDLYEREHMGAFRKIFVKNCEQFQEYRRFYDFSEEHYAQQNRLFGSVSTPNTHYYLPFLKDNHKRRERRESSLYSTSQRKKESVRSIQPRRAGTAKPSRRVLVSSSKNLMEEKGPRGVDIYLADSPNFQNNKIQGAFSKKKTKRKSESIKKEYTKKTE